MSVALEQHSAPEKCLCIIIVLLKPSYFGVVKASYLVVKDGSIVSMVLGVLNYVDLANLVLRNNMCCQRGYEGAQLQRSITHGLTLVMIKKINKIRFSRNGPKLFSYSIKSAINY